jgi:hypothetical protein
VRKILSLIILGAFWLSPSHMVDCPSFIGGQDAISTDDFSGV